MFFNSCIRPDNPCTQPETAAGTFMLLYLQYNLLHAPKWFGCTWQSPGRLFCIVLVPPTVATVCQNDAVD